MISQLATLATRADKATGPPPTNFYELRDNLALDALPVMKPSPVSQRETSMLGYLQVMSFLTAVHLANCWPFTSRWEIAHSPAFAFGVSTA